MEEGSGEEVDRISLIKMNDTAYVWKSEDWSRLRSLRIVGCLVGNLATLSKQDRIATLPMLLLNEETTLLLEKGYAKLITLPSIVHSPDEELKKVYCIYREKLFSEQVELLKKKRKREIESKIDIIVKGKRSKRVKLSGGGGNSEQLDEKDILQEEINKIENSQTINLSVQLSTRDPWIRKGDIADADWPNFHSQKLNYRVFKDLWEKGYYLTLGGKFGGDYLAYPGDPIRFHAFFIIICLDKFKKLRMQDIVTYGRLGQSVKKTVVLSYLNENNEISYHSIQWAGF